MAFRRCAGYDLDAPHAGGDRAFRKDAEQADIAGPPDMGAAAQFGRIEVAGLAGRQRPHRDDPHLFAVFLAEQGERPGLDGGVRRHQAGRHVAVGADAAVHIVLDGGDVVGRQRLRVAEIEAHPVRSDQRTLLGHMIAEHPAQGLVGQVGDRMVGADPGPAFAVDAQPHGVADRHRAPGNRADMDVQALGALDCVGNPDSPALGLERSGIADLAAGFGVEGRLVGDDRDRVASFGTLDLGAVAHQGDDLAFGALGLVAEEFGRAVAVAQAEPDSVLRPVAGAGPGLARFGALALHGCVEAVQIDRPALAAQHILGEIEGEAVGVVEPEGDLAGERFAVAEPVGLLGEQLQAAVQGLAEAGFLQLQRLADQGLGAQQFREGVAHDVVEHRDQPVHQRVARTDPVGVAHRPAHDPAQDVAAALVGRQHTVGDQEGRGAQMVGDRLVARALRPVRIALRGAGGAFHDRADQVAVVVVVSALEDRRDPLQPHTGIDRRPGQRLAAAVLELLELHEDEVPDLDEAVTVLVRAARRPAGDAVAVIVENLGARPARPGIAHRPEIVRGGDADDPALRQAGDLAPQAEGFFVLGIDRRQQPVGGQAVFLRDQVPGELDRDILEIVAEGEIAEHLEKGVMPRGVADIFEIVVLAAGAHAFLRGHRPAVVPLLEAGEDIFELHHAGIDEHERRVVARHQRARRDRRVAVAREEIDEGRTDFVACGHGDNLWLGGQARRAAAGPARRPIAARSPRTDGSINGGTDGSMT